MSRLLIIKTSSMGDVIHTLAAVTDAKQARQDLRIDWVVEEGFADIPTWHPAVERVIPIALRRWRKAPVQAFKNGDWQQFKKSLQQAQYDYVIDAQGLLKSAVVTKLAHGETFGYDKLSAREPLSRFFYQHLLHVDKNQHAVTRSRELFAKAMGYVQPTSIPDYGLSFSQNTKKPIIVFIHATSRDDKYWREEAWRELASIATKAGFEVHLPWGSDTEKARAERIADGIAHVTVLPKMRLTELAEHLANAKGAVSVDTGLGHLAAALALPNVSLYGPTDPKKIGAFGANQVYADLHQDSPEFVWDKLAEMLSALPTQVD
jgi:lipopolysaccharide heptosyltransferase I